MSEISTETPPVPGDGPTFGEVYWDAYANSDPACIEHVPFATLMADTRRAIERGALAVAAHVINRTAGEAAEPAARYALVEQMGHRATVATVRETTFCGAPMLEVTDLKAGSVHLVSPQSLYEITWLNEDQARQRTKPWTATALPAADPWSTAESDLDDAGSDADEGNDNGTTTPEPGTVGEPRDLAGEGEADTWFRPGGVPAAVPVSPIEAAARRVVWPEDQPQQQAAASGVGPQAAQMLS